MCNVIPVFNKTTCTCRAWIGGGVEAPPHPFPCTIWPCSIGCVIWACHFLGRYNVISDTCSRMYQIITSEWALYSYGNCWITMDLFATINGRRLYVCPVLRHRNDDSNIYANVAELISVAMAADTIVAGLISDIGRYPLKGPTVYCLMLLGVHSF